MNRVNYVKPEVEFTQGLFNLMSLVQQKNDLNRRRRRFMQRMKDATEKPSNQKRAKQLYAVNGYCKAQKDMKKFTKRIKKAYRAINACVVWNEGGMMSYIKTSEGVFIKQRDFKRMMDDYVAERVLLVDEI